MTKLAASEPGTPDSYPKLMNMMSARKFPWHSWNPASKTATTADNADEDSEQDT
jgi:hypothetical protein